MLADQLESAVQSGGLDESVHLPATWRLTLLDFIASELPVWRDDPKRPAELAETSLTSRLCAHMNSATRKSCGWDFLQFRVEEPDERVGGRKVDMVPAARAATIWIDGREYTQYMALLPIECKRLPIPTGQDRDEREYLYSAHSSTGGIQRFKAGHHGAAHSHGAMIGYIQKSDIDFWNTQMQKWINDLVDAQIDGWALDDELVVTKHDAVAKVASLESEHQRIGQLTSMRIRHLWIEM